MATRLRKQIITRRALLGGAAMGSGALASGLLPRPLLGAPAVVTPERLRPSIPHGVQSGDIVPGRAVVWSRTDRPARMFVEYATTESFRDSSRVAGPAALETSNFTARVDLADLPAGQRIFYRVTFQDLSDPAVFSPPAAGSFRTAPAALGDITFAWSADTAGQGWGINPDWGGMRMYETIRRSEPHFFIHSGDTVYADGPLKAEVPLDNGKVWKNLVTPEKSKVAETQAEFWGNHRYNLMDANVRRFNAEVPQMAQWDDHETTNNWFPGRRLDLPAYTVTSCDLLAARGRKAFLDYLPLRPSPQDPERIYRAFPYGPLLEVVMLDERSYRGPNTANRQPEMSPETAFLGSEQMRWLKARLLSSRATWKVIASDMPVGLVVGDGRDRFEALANGAGPALGRELEFAELFRFIKRNRIRNVVWVTGDVHYAAAHQYHPSRARFTDFDPFWEFTAGPMNAGNFGPNTLDNTFGPEVKFHSIPPGTKANRPPSDGLQFFGLVKIDGKSEVMTVSLHDLSGKSLYNIDLSPER